MASVIEIACRARADQAAAARGWYEKTAIPAWSSLPGLTVFDLYVPAAGHARDPMVDDGSGPLFLNCRPMRWNGAFTPCLGKRRRRR